MNEELLDGLRYDSALHGAAWQADATHGKQLCGLVSATGSSGVCAARISGPDERTLATCLVEDVEVEEEPPAP